MRPPARIRVATALAALAGLVLTLTPGAPAAAVAVDQWYPVPGSGTYTVRGHGYGHGIGMSQHGAQGAAIAGRTHEQILDFYFPGTTLGSASYKIKVLITADTTPDLVVLPTEGLLVRDSGTKTLHPLPTNLGASRWRLVVVADNRNAVEYLAGNVWKRWRPGNREVLAGEGAFRASGPVTLVLPSGATRAYRGSLRAAAPNATTTDRDTVNIISMDNYVRGVVAREMPASWKPEAVQAQSVAARTYGAFLRAENLLRHYQICDTTSCQVYGGVQDEHPLSDAAVAATAGQVLLHEGEPSFTQFSASSGGWTAVGSRPYLTAKADPYDDWSGNTSHDWSVKLASSRIRDAYPGLGRLRGLRVTSRDGNGEWKGRVLRIVLDGTKKDVVLSGADFRFRFGLKSHWFSF